MSTIFISHSSKDQKVARAICAALESRGIDCWLASRNIGPGDNFQEAIVKAIQSAKAMVLVFTDNANNSAEIKKELALASQNKLAVIPARTEDVVPTAALAYELATRQWINLFEDWEHEIENLCARVRQILPPPASDTAPPQPSAQSPTQPIVEPASPPIVPAAAAKPKAARVAPLWLAVTFVIFGLARLGLSSTFVEVMSRNRNWRLDSYLLAGDMLAPGLLIVIVGILLMVAARWANATATAICIVALLHDAVWLALWYMIHSNAGAEAVVFHFGPMVASMIACASILGIQIWRQTADFRRSLGRRGDLAALNA
jgi:TIR domain